MKNPGILVALLFLGVSQMTNAASTPATTQGQTIPPATARRIVERGANHRVWLWETYEEAPGGKIIPHVHKVTELAGGMHYRDANGQWAESQEVIESYSQGAIAQQGQNKVIFAGNINSRGSVDMYTPDGRRLRSNLLGLMYYDTATGDAVLIAEVRDASGQLVGNNKVIYPDAFDGVRADVQYTYRRSGFEQDVILREQPPSPEQFGLNSATTELEVFTEFLNPPTASVVNVDAANDALEADQKISWGAVTLGRGKAFNIGGQDQVAVSKRYLTIQGRHFLLEKVPVKAIAKSLAELPEQAVNQRSLPHLASKTIPLPTPRLVAQGKPMLRSAVGLATVTSAQKGYVLDYVTLNTSFTNYTFQGDSTYHISGLVNLYSTTVLEGGAVIKIDTNSTVGLNVLGTVDCRTAPYRPAVFTSSDDTSIGEQTGGGGASCYGTLNLQVVNNLGSYEDLYVTIYDDNWNTYVNWETVGNASYGSYAYTAGLGQHYFMYAYDQYWNEFYVDFYPLKTNGVITVASDGSTSYSESGTDLCTPPAAGNPVALSLANGGLIHDVRFLNIGVGLASADDFSLVSAQFVNCANPIKTDNANFYAGNILISLADTAFSGQSYHGQVQHLTVDQAAHLADDANGTNSTSTLTLTNCLLTVVDISGPVMLTTNHFENLSSNSGVYETVGGGNYYLPTNSPYLMAGTGAVEPALRYWLATKTTQVPLIFTNEAIYGPTNFPPYARRDTNSALTLGYHYDPIDYAFGGCDVYTNITFTAGTAVAWFHASSGFYHAGQGIHLDDQKKCAFNGTATAPCYWVLLNTVQEQNQTTGYAAGGFTSWADQEGSITNAAIVSARFLRCVSMGGAENSFRDDWGILIGNFTDCEFYNVGLGSYVSSYYVTNCLFNRSSLGIWAGRPGNEIYARNCTFRGYYVYFVASDYATPITVVNSIFDSIDNFYFGGYGSDPAYANYSYNAYTGSNPFPVGSNNVPVTNLNWQPGWLGNFYLPTNSPLINAGSTTANQIGLYHFTTQASQIKETNSIVDLGYHYVATDAYGNPLDSNGDGILDHIEDANGNGIYDSGDLANWQAIINVTVPGGWYSTNGLSSSNPLIGIQDADWDGLLNQQEYLYGTNPQISEGFNVWIVNPSAGF